MTYDARSALLWTHAEKLSEGEEEARRFERRQQALSPDVIALFALAWRLKRALTPIAAPADFRLQLYRELTAHSENSNRNNWQRMRRPLYYSLAAAGSVLPLLGIAIWRRRRRSPSILGSG